MTGTSVGNTAREQPRIHPAEALRAGRSDATRLLASWYVRKSFYWLLFTGLTAAYLTDRTEEIDVDWSDAGSVLTELLSPLAGLVLAVVARIGANLAALASAYRLARDYEAPLERRTGLGSGIGRWLDRRNLAKAFRALRWTHHVRQEALRRLGATGERVGRLDPILDVVNIGSFLILMLTVLAVTPT